MPRASLNPQDAVASKQFGITEGNVEIIDAKVKVHQYPPNKDTGRQAPPFLCVQETLRLLDANFEPVEDQEPVVIELSLGKSAINKFSPGQGENEDDDNPEDMGNEVDAEGNMMYAADPASTLNDKCKWVEHSNSLIKCGFRPDKIHFMPNLIGLKGHVKTETRKFTGEDGKEGNSTVNVFDKIVHFPYEAPAKGAKGKGGAAAKSTPAPAAAGKGKSTPASAPAKSTPAASDNGSSDSAATLLSILDDPKAKLTGDMELSKFYLGVQRALMLAKKGRDEITAVMAFVKDNEALSEWGTESGRVIVDADAETVSILPG